LTPLTKDLRTYATGDRLTKLDVECLRAAADELDRVSPLGAEWMAQHAIAVIDAQCEHDQQYCCDGQMCGCQGVSVHTIMKHYINAERPASADLLAEALRLPEIKALVAATGLVIEAMNRPDMPWDLPSRTFKELFGALAALPKGGV